jgi:hypothetical protein
MDRDVLFSLAEANKILVRWVQDHSYIDRDGHRRASAYMTAHYSLFLQLRQELLADRAISKQDAEQATMIANYPFSAKAKKEIEKPAVVQAVAVAPVTLPSLAPFPLHASPFESQKMM